jgi:hypothetical protein
LKCAYSLIFENPVEKDTPYLPGREYAPQPYVINVVPFFSLNVKFLKFEILLIGNRMEYAPYFFAALKMAGEEGLLKERIKFRINKVSSTLGEYTLEQAGNGEIPKEKYLYHDDGDTCDINLNVIFLSPFRYKKAGRYISDIYANDLLAASARRLNMLSGFFGNEEQIKLPQVSLLCERDIRWHEDSRYSARQRTTMTLGGVLGKMSIMGTVPRKILSVLDGAKRFNIGKCISFGFGNIDIKESV